MTVSCCRLPLSRKRKPWHLIVRRRIFSRPALRLMPLVCKSHGDWWGREVPNLGHDGQYHPAGQKQGVASKVSIAVRTCTPLTVPGYSSLCASSKIMEAGNSRQSLPLLRSPTFAACPFVKNLHTRQKRPELVVRSFPFPGVLPTQRALTIRTFCERARCGNCAPSRVHAERERELCKETMSIMGILGEVRCLTACKMMPHFERGPFRMAKEKLGSA